MAERSDANWRWGGYCGLGNVGPLIGALRTKTAIICGNAKGVFEELQALRDIYDYGDISVFAVNDVGMYLPRVDHWVSLHWANIYAWREVRWLLNRGVEDIRYHSVKQDDEKIIDYLWEELTPVFALSGYFAMQIAYIMGADKIILCGCPGEPAPRFFEAQPRSDFGYGMGLGSADTGIFSQLVGEMTRVPDFKSKVRSMSGWTKSYFGGGLD